MDNINLFGIITMLSFCLLAPVALLMEGVRFTPSAMRAAGILNTQEVTKHILIAALCFHSYQQVCLPPMPPKRPAPLRRPFMAVYTACSNCLPH